MKEQVRASAAPRKIKQIQFGVLTPEEMAELGELEIVRRELFQVTQDRAPIPFGCLDRRLGISDKNNLCHTCGEKLADCSGHFGYINLDLPVFHIGYFRAIIIILQSVCKNCSAFLLLTEEKINFLKKLRNPNLDSLQRLAIVKAAHEKAKKVVLCPYCSSFNGTVKKIGALKIVHEKFKAKKASDDLAAFRKTFSHATEDNPEIKTHLSKAVDDLHPLRVLELFQKISSEDCELLGLDPDTGRPELFIWRKLLVPPVCIRPSVAMSQEGGSNEDDLTVKLTEIVYTNQIIKEARAGGSPMHMIMEDWDFLQLQCAMYINAELPGIPPSIQMSNRPIRGFCQRLKGKQGRFRGNLSGKRVDFSSRTVISPDPNLKINEIGVPVYVAKTLTYPEGVTSYNIHKMRQLVINGADVHPGANYIQSENGLKRSLKFGDRHKAAAELRIGDIVERHLDDGDVVLFNRQPSLHKLSIMAHYAKVRPWRTFRFNECVCTPYNADFDGDEMNLHLPQTEEARAEAIELMGVINNLVTPRNGQPLIAATQDFITSSYLITSKDVFLSKAEFCKLIAYFCDAEIHIDLPPPTILKPVKLWTGKQVINVLINPNKKTNVFINLETKTRNFIRMEGRPPEFCPNDGYLIIRNSEIMAGQLDKSNIGGENKSASLFYTIMRDYGNDYAALCMTRLAKLCARFLGNRGFSIGINDVQPGMKLQKQKDVVVEQGYRECDLKIKEFKEGKLQNQPGCTAEQTLEACISQILSKIRDDVGQICLQELSKNNSPLIMQACGSKGSKINVSQMVACVGQQIVGGSRIPEGFVNRTLPHFLVKSKIPAAKGFVRNSFYTGLSPTEFFFHAVSGREGLVDTAVKTAETGYMQRRLMKALEDLSTQYDYSVRNSIGGVVQFCYGDDGLDPASMEGDEQPVNLARNLLHAKSLISASGSPPLLPYQVTEILKEFLGSVDYQKYCSLGFLNYLSDFVLKQIVEPLARARQKFGLDPCLDKFRNSVEITELVVNSQKSVNCLYLLTEPQLSYFFRAVLSKYINAKIEPGTAVGAIGAQSIGEPGTQMTLKTFHFAGVASMNVTLGVPRIKEIINAAKTISTPIITAKLFNENSIASARIVKGRIEKTYLGDIAEYIEEVYTPSECYVELCIDLAAISALQLEIDLATIERALLKAPKLKLAPNAILTENPDKIRVYASLGKDQDSIYYALQSLKRALPKVIVKGFPNVSRAVINDLGSGRYNLLVEGYGLRDVMITEGVNGRQTTCNHIMEIQKVLGIEAARSTIASEIQYTMSKHGMTIDSRHVILLADVMTYKGEVLGITRFGISKMKDSVLMLASFEKTTDHLFEASLRSKIDSIDGVSECIIMGVPMPVGTGLFKVLQKVESLGKLCPRSTIF